MCAVAVGGEKSDVAALPIGTGLPYPICWLLRPLVAWLVDCVIRGSLEPGAALGGAR